MFLSCLVSMPQNKFGLIYVIEKQSLHKSSGAFYQIENGFFRLSFGCFYYNLENSIDTFGIVTMYHQQGYATSEFHRHE